MSKPKMYFTYLMLIALLTLVSIPRTVLSAPPENGICNGPEGVMTLLVIGTDYRGLDYAYGLADSIMIIRADFTTGAVAFMGIDRGIWVEIPDVEEDNGRTHGKITQAYFFGTQGNQGYYYQGPDYGAGLLKETLRHNWGVEVDRYLVVNMRTFRNLIDAIGGIKVYNPYPLFTFKKNQPVILVGGYLFSGTDALMYARYRDPRNVLDRVDRQSIVLKAVYDQVFSVSTIPKIPQILGVYRNNLLSDLSLAELSQLACLAARTDPEQVKFMKIPQELLYIPDWSSSPWLEKEPGSIAKVLQDFWDGYYQQ